MFACHVNQILSTKVAVALTRDHELLWESPTNILIMQTFFSSVEKQTITNSQWNLDVLLPDYLCDVLNVFATQCFKTNIRRTKLMSLSLSLFTSFINCYQRPSDEPLRENILQKHRTLFLPLLTACEFHAIGIREKNSFSDRATVLPFIRLSFFISRVLLRFSWNF